SDATMVRGGGGGPDAGERGARRRGGGGRGAGETRRQDQTRRGHAGETSTRSESERAVSDGCRFGSSPGTEATTKVRHPELPTSDGCRVGPCQGTEEPSRIGAERYQDHRLWTGSTQGTQEPSAPASVQHPSYGEGRL